MEDDLETEDMNPELAALSVNYPELAGKSEGEMQRAFLPMYLSAVQSEKAAREKSAIALKDRYNAAEEAIKQQRFGAPTTSQQLAALSQALLAPRRMRGFAGTLANIMPAITEPADLRAAAETKREAALRQLREQYATAADASAVGTAAAKREALAKVLPLMKPSSAGLTYDSTRGIFVNQREPRPTENTYDIGGGRTLVQWQDGLWREAQPDGNYRVFERAGNVFEELTSEGAR
jgi:hypothetical protein